MNKQGYPEEVYVVSGKDMCREHYYLKGKCCLLGWTNANFPHPKGHAPEDDLDTSFQTKANTKARCILESLIEPLLEEDEYKSIEEFNDIDSENLKLNLNFLARLYNTMLDRMGYKIAKKDMLTKKELKIN